MKRNQVAPITMASIVDKIIRRVLSNAVNLFAKVNLVMLKLAMSAFMRMWLRNWLMKSGRNVLNYDIFCMTT
jgi:hypothetical protein